MDAHVDTRAAQSTSGVLPYELARRVVELATAAPSVHNTQPWAFRIDGETITLYADVSRRLVVEDPVGRDLVISCGAVLHHLQVAAAALGWSTTVDRLPRGSDPTLLAQVHVEPAAETNDSTSLTSLLERRTDRRRFTSWPVPDQRLQHLAEVAGSWGCHAVPLLEDLARTRVELLVETARARDGLRTQFGPGQLADGEAELESADGIIVLGGTADAVGTWLRTGEALSALWLEATEGGLSVVPLSRPVEVEQTRTSLRREVLGGLLMPHLVLRIGWQSIGRSQLPPSPRRPVEDGLRT